jgi:tetratricopeptide (TPR) repeat protein
LYRKQLVLEEVVGRKDGMASAYTNLGNMYGRQGDLDQAEALYRKALTLFQEIGAFAQVEQVQKSLRILRAQGSP